MQISINSKVESKVINACPDTPACSAEIKNYRTGLTKKYLFIMEDRERRVLNRFDGRDFSEVEASLGERERIKSIHFFPVEELGLYHAITFDCVITTPRKSRKNIAKLPQARIQVLPLPPAPDLFGERKDGGRAN